MKSKDKLLVDIAELEKLLSCNRQHASRIGAEAKATIRVGRKILYSVKKVQEYLTEHTS